MFLQKIFYRLYSDFLLPSRLAEYKAILAAALQQGYEIHSVASFWELIQKGQFDAAKRYFINRHDIDTDLATARLMFQIEKEMGVRASYYFRLSTIDTALMKEIAANGSEVGYHFEELATVAKTKGLTKENIGKEMVSIQALFKQNLQKLREKTKLPMHIVASHGDFLNRRLKLKNCALLDQTLRRETKIDLEVYDEVFKRYITSRHADTHFPLFYQPVSPLAAIMLGEKVIYFLTHPRHWRANFWENLKHNLNRCWEECLYFFRSRSSRGNYCRQDERSFE